MIVLTVGAWLLLSGRGVCAGGAGEHRAIPRSVYLEKVHGWWLGKIIGVTLGGPYEFSMPWPPPEITDYVHEAPVSGYFSDNDDLYVGMAFLLSLERHGPGVTREQMAAEFFERLEPGRLWLANLCAYKNLAAGVAPPKTGHPVFNEYAWSIDAQIQNDAWGVVSPGMIDAACGYAEQASRITNYADGAYGGVFAAALASAAFVENDIGALVETALMKIPPESDYAQAVRDVIGWHRENPSDWKATREKIARKWQDAKGHRAESAVLNGAAVVIALLYSGGDFDAAVRIGTMAGWDTDCNASSAGGIIGIITGARAIPAKWDIYNDRYKNVSLRGLPLWMTISGLAARTATLGETVIASNGGRIEGERLIIPRREPPPPPPADSPFPIGPEQEREWAALRAEKLDLDLRLWNPALTLRNCRADGTTGLIREFRKRRHVFRTVPAKASEPCVMTFSDVGKAAKDEEVILEISACGSGTPWELSAAAGGRELGRTRIGEDAPAGLRAVSIVPSRDEDIILYVAEDGSTYFDEALTRLAQASPSFDPARRPEPLRIRSAQNNVNLFKYPGTCPPGKDEIRSYFILTEWTDSTYPIIWLSPGDPHPYGCYWPKEHVPDLPLPDPKPVKLRIRAEEELPSIPEGGKFVLMHDESRATVISLPRVSTEPSPWHRVRYDLTPHLRRDSTVEVRGGPAGEGEGEAYWDHVRIVRRPRLRGTGGQALSERRQR
ncbi:MAG: ADP-ribosylglycohydrolase family protein [bacterium]|nr:ADP-ribosylglycohydrolase family protein [bacterium]